MTGPAGVIMTPRFGPVPSWAVAGQRSRVELQQAADGIRYRMRQMAWCIEALVVGDGTGKPYGRVVRNALIVDAGERRVLAYFVSKPKKAREVTVCDYLTSDQWDWKAVERDVGRFIGLVSDHLTHAMHVDPPEPWELIEIAKRLLLHMAQFLVILGATDEEQAGWFGDFGVLARIVAAVEVKANE